MQEPRRKETKTLRSVLLRRLLALSGAVLFVIGGIMAAFLYKMSYQTALQQAEKAAASAGNHISLLVDSLNNISSMIAYNSVTQNALFRHKRGDDGREKNGLSTLFASTAQYIRLIDNFVLLDSDCEYYTSMFGISEERKRTIAEFIRELPREQKSGRVFWYMPGGELEGKAVLVRAIHSTDSASLEFIGYLMITVDICEMYASARQFQFDKESKLFITDNDGVVLYAQAGAESDRDMSDVLLQSAPCTYMTVEGRPVLAAYSEVRGSGWKLVELTPKTTVLHTVWKQTSGFVLAFAIATLLFSIVQLLLTRSLTTPFAKMQEAMYRIEKGDFDIPNIPTIGIREIDALLLRFGEMAARLNDTIEEMYCARLREKELALSAQQSEIEMLQQQINPHFLYNTLDSINWMASFGATEEVSRMIIALSNFFRFTVSDHSAFTQISKEVEFAQNYVYLQKRRFGSLLTVKFDVERQAQDCLTLRLLLQPLIENAIVHGTMRAGREGVVKVSIRREAEMIRLEVEDNGEGMDEQTVRDICGSRDKKGIGLPNIMRRLELLFGERHTFGIDSAPGKGTRIRIEFPAVRTQEELEKMKKWR